MNKVKLEKHRKDIKWILQDVYITGKREVFDDIDKFVKKFDFWMTGSRIEVEYRKVREKHLNTQDTEKVEK